MLPMSTHSIRFENHYDRPTVSIGRGERGRPRKLCQRDDYIKEGYLEISAGDPVRLSYSEVAVVFRCLPTARGAVL